VAVISTHGMVKKWHVTAT